MRRRLGIVGASVRALLGDDRGMAALTGALLLPVMIGAGALAVDMAHYRLLSNQLQSAADAGALAGVQRFPDFAMATQDAVAYSLDNVPASFGAVTEAADVTMGVYDVARRTFTPTNVDANAIRVIARRSIDRDNAAPMILGSIFGGASPTIGAASIAARPRSQQFVSQTLFNLGSESASFNEVAAYCFDYAGRGSAESRRSQMTVIAQNVEPEIKGFYWPRCGAGQSLSFRLRTVGMGRWYPERVTATNGSNYFSDTVIKNGKQVFDKSIAKMLEVVRCDTAAQCRPKSQGGIVPEGPKRTPVQSPAACEPGKFIYFGGEDWTDADFDDIRFAMACPNALTWVYGRSRLVR